MTKTYVDAPEAQVLAGVARCDITPPVGMYHRMWGAATHERSTGIHRPLSATALYLAPHSGAGAGIVILALDHCLVWKSEADAILHAISQATGLQPDRVTLAFSHTHGSGLLDPGRADLPGGDLLAPYLTKLTEQLGALVKQARASAVPATLTFGTGRCDLATHRDYIDADGRAVCGFNPGGPTDDTVVVGRAISDDGRLIATIVNYACHPTTLAWENTRISPDFVGSMREVIETIYPAPCVFIQGASGDIGPKHGFVGDAAIADRNGRQLGYAALSALEGLPPPAQRFHYSGPVVSGATLGRWDYHPAPVERLEATRVWSEHPFEIRLKYRPDLRHRDVVEAERARWQAVEAAATSPAQARDARAMVERETRYLSRIRHLPQGSHFPLQTRIVRMGDLVWIPLDGEHYNVLQRQLRERFPGRSLLIGTIANGSNIWYLPDQASYGLGLYQEEVSVVERGSLEQLIQSLAVNVDKLFA